MNSTKGWLRATLLIVGGLLALTVLLLALMAWLLPGFAKNKMIELARQETGRELAIGAIDLESFRWAGPRVRIDDLQLADRTKDSLLFAFKRLEVDVSWRSITSMAPVVDAVTLEQPSLQLARDAKGVYNIQDLIDKIAKRPKSADPPPHFAVANLSIKQGKLRFDDQEKAVMHEVKELLLQVPFVSSLPVHQKVHVLPKLAAIIDGAPFSFDGQTLPFDDARSSELAIRLDGVNLPKYLAYSPVALPVTLKSALLNLDLKLRFSQPANQSANIQILGAAQLEKVEVTDKAGGPLLSFERLRLEGIDSQPLQQRVKLGRVEWSQPRLLVERNTVAGGFAEAVTREIRPASAPGNSANAPAVAAPWAWSVDAIAVLDANIDFKDAGLTPAVLPKPLVLKASPLNLTINGLSSEKDSGAKYELKAAFSGGESFKVAGALGVAPFKLDGQASLSEVLLKTWWWAAAPHLALDAPSGKLAAQINFAVDPAAPAAKVTLSNLSVDLEQLVLQQTWDKKELLKLASLRVEVPAIKLDERKVQVGLVKAQAARLLVERDRSGVVNLSRLSRQAAAASDATAVPQDSAAPAWVVDLNALVLDQSALRIRDIDARGEADLDINALSLKAENLTTRSLTDAKQRGKLEVSAKIDKSGSLKVAGPLGLAPLGGQLDVDLRAAPLLPAQPYFTQYVNALVSNGSLSTKGRVSIEPSGIGYRGDISLTEFASVTKDANEDLLKWKNLFVGGLDLRLAPFALAINEVALSDFYSRLIVRADGRLNLQDVVVQRNAVAGAAPVTPAPPVAASAPPADIKIGKVTLANGNIDFTDLFIRPNYSANLTSMNGAISGLSPQTPGDLELRGKVDNAGAVEILGKLNPLSKDLFLDLNAKARDIDLPRLTPYSAKYVGYGIEKGKLSVTLRYFIEGRKLKAENNVMLDQLTFGEKIDSPTATKLPVLFAVSLLKDRNGVIDINLPISGSLDDPEFSVAGLVWKVIGNLIVKAVTAPFSLLASLAGGGAELSNVEFMPGAAALDDAGKTRLATLAKALADRPALRLDLAGRVHPEQDRDALRKLQVERLLKAQKLKETVATGANAGALDAIQIGAQEYEKYLRLAYRQSDIPKPRNTLGQLRDLSREEMETLLLTNTKVEEGDLLNLANARAQAAKDHLVGEGKIPGERLFVVAPRLNVEGIKSGSKPTQVEMSLK